MCIRNSSNTKVKLYGTPQNTLFLFEAADLTLAVTCYVLQCQKLLTGLERYNMYYSLDHNSAASW